MAADTIVTGAKLTAIADALRGLLGTQSTYTLDELATAIAGIQTGGDDNLLRASVGLFYASSSGASAMDDIEFELDSGWFDELDGLCRSVSSLATHVRPWEFYASGLKSIALGSGARIGSGAFACSNLQSISLPTANNSWSFETGNQTLLPLVGATRPSTNVSPFCSCSRLPILDLRGASSSSWSYMGYLVAGCTSLTDLTLPTNQSITKLNESAFRGAKAHRRVEIPANFTNLYQNASGTFQENDALEEVDILGSPKILGGTYSSYFYSTFGSSNTTFRRLIIRGSTMAQIVGSSGAALTSNGFIFGGTYNSSISGYDPVVPANLTIYVPDGLVSTYQADVNWGNYASIITGLSDLPSGS